MLKRSLLSSSSLCLRCLKSTRIQAARSYSIAAVEQDVEEQLPVADIPPPKSAIDAELAIKKLKHRSEFAINNNKEELLVCSVTAMALLQDLQTQNKHPSRSTAENLLRIACLAGIHAHVEIILDLFKKYWIPLRGPSILAMTRFYIEAESPEQCLDFLEAQVSSGIRVPLAAWAQLVVHLLRIDEYDAALSTMQRVDELAKGVESMQLTPATYYRALSCFARAYHAAGLQYTWQRAISSNLLTTVDIGLCTNVLNGCARHGLPILATDVMNYLARIGASAQGYHYASLIQSYCQAGDVRTALKILSIMRDQGVAPTNITPTAIIASIAVNLDTIDRAFFTLQDIKAEGGTIDITAFNAILDACVVRKDLSRAIATYEEHDSLGVVPNIDTLNALLTGCVGSYAKDLAIKLIDTFATNHGISPDATSYHNLIAVCILQQNYDDTFTFLEQMKEAGHQPPLAIYTAIYHRLLNERDSRAQIAKDEARGWGYRIQERNIVVNERTTGVFARIHSITTTKNFRPR